MASGESLRALNARRATRRKLFNEKIKELRELIPTPDSSHHRGSTFATLADAISALRIVQNESRSLGDRLEHVYLQNVSLCTMCSAQGDIKWVYGKDLKELHWNNGDVIGCNIFERTFWKDIPLLMRAMDSATSSTEPVIIRLRGSGNKYIEFLIRVYLARREEESGEKLFGVVGKKLPLAGVSPSVRPRQEKPQRIVSLMQAGGDNGVSHMVTKVFRPTAPFGIPISEWFRALPALVHPHDHDINITKHRAVASQKTVQTCRMVVFNHGTCSLMRIVTYLSPCVDSSGKLVAIIGDSREERDDEEEREDLERCRPIHPDIFVGDLRESLAFVQTKIQEKRRQYEQHSQQVTEREHDELAAMYSEMARYVEAFGHGKGTVQSPHQRKGGRNVRANQSSDSANGKISTKRKRTTRGVPTRASNAVKLEESELEAAIEQVSQASCSLPQYPGSVGWSMSYLGRDPSTNLTIRSIPETPRADWLGSRNVTSAFGFPGNIQVEGSQYSMGVASQPPKSHNLGGAVGLFARPMADVATYTNASVGLSSYGRSPIGDFSTRVIGPYSDSGVLSYRSVGLSQLGRSSVDDMQQYSQYAQQAHDRNDPDRLIDHLLGEGERLVSPGNLSSLNDHDFYAQTVVQAARKPDASGGHPPLSHGRPGPGFGSLGSNR